MNRLFFFLVLIPFYVLADNSSPIWTVYWDEKTELKGFKDESGQVKIPPKYTGFTIATRFRNIIAAMEYKEQGYESYYLLKDGRKIKPEEMYVSDMSFDCESENKIRFRSSDTDKVGFLNAQGKIVIPAAYSDARPFKNGLSSVIKNAIRTCHDGSEFSRENMCEHWHWGGGDTYIINAMNEVLIENAYLKDELDPHSLIVTDEPVNSNLVESFQGKNGKYYNFINNELSFEYWLKNELVINLDVPKLLDNSYKNFTLWDDAKRWYQTSSRVFSRKQLNIIVSELSALKTQGTKHFVSIDNLNIYVDENEEGGKYFDDCSRSRVDKYPLLSLVTNHRVDGKYMQNSYSFLKTDDGFKLIGFTIRTTAHL